MKSKYLISVLLILAVLASDISAGDITPEIYPYEDELYEAYLAGDIDYPTYLNLREIFEGGIDSSEIYLLEEIPNLNFFLKSIKKDYSDRENEQAETYWAPQKDKRFKSIGYIKNSTYRKLEENGDFKNSLQIKSKLNRDWTTELRYRQDYEGNPSWSKRSLYYSNERKRIRKIIIGNYTARFGLGLTVGYRGSLLSKSEMSANQLFIAPEYGGYNGIYVEGGRRKEALRLMVHYDRNLEFEVGIGAANFSRQWSEFRLEGTLLGGVIKKRGTDSSYNHYQLGSFVQYSKERFSSSIEMSLAKGAAKYHPAVLAETIYRTQLINFKFSAWFYDRDYINLMGGGRAGNLYQTVEIDESGFSFSDRRRNQTGFLLKSRLLFEKNISVDVSVSAWGSDQNNQIMQTLLGIESPLTNTSTIGIDYDYSFQQEPGEFSEKIELRTVYRLKTDKINLRSYFGYDINQNEQKYFSLFSRLRLKNIGPGNFEFWFNMNKINPETKQLDYFYGFIRESFIPVDKLEISAKYSYRYNRNYSNREESTFMLEAKLVW